MTQADLGLRERKRRATKRAIQRAVLALAAARGFENVTVEEVSREADIAPRTFFNYFPTKEAALIGDMPAAPSSNAVATFVGGGPTGQFFVDFGELVAEQLSEFDVDRELHSLRHSVFRDSPHLAKLHFATLRDMEERFAELIRQRIAAHGTGAAPGALMEDALLLGNIAGATMRSAFMQWSRATDDTPLVDRVRRSFARVSGVIAEYR